MIQVLSRTGMPLGAFRGVTWEQETLQLAPGDVLLLYTDGVTDAEDEKGAFFGQERLLGVARANLGRSAQDLQDALMTAVHELLELDDKLRRLVLQDADLTEIEQEAVASGMIRMKDDGMAKVAQGLTTTEEVMRVCMSG